MTPYEEMSELEAQQWLQELFIDELCHECGRDWPDHTVGPDAFGLPHAYCSRPKCAHCSEPIRYSGFADLSVPWVHDHSGNAACDVTTPATAVANAHMPAQERYFAEPL